VAPEQVLGGYVRDSGGTDYPIVGMLSAGQYRNLIDKSYTSGRPDRIWVNYTAPNVTVYTYPIPDTAESLYLQSIKPFTEITATNQNLAVALGIPRSYHSALTFNLAVDLAPHFNRQLDPTIAARAMRSKQTIINLNAARNLRPVALEVPMGEYSYGSFDGDNLI
jgi:hypothetical protein